MSDRRAFLKRLAAVGLAGAALASRAGGQEALSGGEGMDRSRVRALLISATTLAGGGSLEHAAEGLRRTYGEARELLLINFASLPEDRDAYEERMRRDFERIDGRFRLRSLHRAGLREAGDWIRQAEGFFVSGGNTFLLLRELYERYAVELLRERVLNGAPYAGSSAGSNIAGIEIGTTNDFPICDVPTRRSLGLFDGLYNPHHPEESDEAGFASRQWKIDQYCRLRPEHVVIGVTNPGMLRLHAGSCELEGAGAAAFLNKGGTKATVYSDKGPALSETLSDLG